MVIKSENNMKEIPAQYHSFRKTTLGDNLVTFRVDQMYSNTLRDLIEQQIGTEFKMSLEKVDVGTILGGSATNDDTEQKFFRQLRAKMREYGEKTGENEEEVKSKLLSALSKRRIDIDSTTELDIKGLAIAIGIMSNMLEE